MTTPKDIRLGGGGGVPQLSPLGETLHKHQAYLQGGGWPGNEVSRFVVALHIQRIV